MAYGPMQLVVMTFQSPNFPQDIQTQLKSVRELGLVRLLDAVFVSKDEDADLLVLEGSDLVQEEAALLGIMAGAFFGYGASGTDGIHAGMEAGLVASENGVFGLGEDDLLEIADRIPVDSSALFLLLEHTWALGLKEAVENNQGAVIANGWITPASLVSMGAISANAGYSSDRQT